MACISPMLFADYQRCPYPHYSRVISYIASGLTESWTEAPGELGELLFDIAGWVARMESQHRSEWRKAGLARVVAKGKKLGRSKGSKDKKKRRRRISFNEYIYTNLPF